jgi:hypothetical protein
VYDLCHHRPGVSWGKKQEGEKVDLYDLRQIKRKNISPNLEGFLFMKKSALIVILCAFNILVVGAFIVWYMSRTYPMIGHDYRLFMPYMIDSYLHQKINGLTIQWYTPSFAGGRPVFPNPQDLQFSLPQFLIWVVNPWIANLISIGVYITIGFIASYTFLKRFLELRSLASILGAVFFIANGFYFNHMAAGHVTFQAFTLFPVIMIIIVHPKLPGWLGGLLLSLICAILLYSGLHDITFFIFTGLIFLPMLYLIKPSLLNGKRLFALALWGGILTLLLCGSKLSAALYFMRFFPRLVQDHYKTNLLTGVFGMISQLIGTMTMAPIYALAERNTANFVLDLIKNTGTSYGFWELDASLSPALLILLAGGAITFLLRKPNIKTPIVKKRLIAVICLILAIWLTIEFTLARGLIYPTIRNLPILESQRVNVRNICAFIFPLAVVGAVVFNNWTRTWKSNTKLLTAFLILNGIALGSLWSYHWIPAKYQEMLCDVRPMLTTYEKIRYEGETFPVENVIPDAEPMDVFQEHAVNLIDPYNTFFKDITRYLTALHAGSVYDTDNGYFNIVDPTGYVFPEVNHSKMYARIPVADQGKFLDFINRRQPKWKLPVIQQVLNWTGLVTLIAEFGALLVWLAKRLVRFPKHASKV